MVEIPNGLTLTRLNQIYRPLVASIQIVIDGLKVEKQTELQCIRYLWLTDSKLELQFLGNF